MIQKYKFPIAPHSYFRALNKEQAKLNFLSSKDNQPVFEYSSQFKPDVIQERLRIVGDDSRATELLSYIKEASMLQIDDTFLDSFRNLNQNLFDTPEKRYALAILNSVHGRSINHPSTYWDEIIGMTGPIPQSESIERPSAGLFIDLKNYFKRYAPRVKSVKQDVANLIELYLDFTGLKKDGWTVQVLKGSTLHAHTHHVKKTISVGDQYKPRKKGAAEYIAVHEVYGHALRGSRSTLDESEGFAVLLEQLLANRFEYRRSYRYLAVSLGWGVLGYPMTFRQVFEILWRVMALGSGYSADDAKSHAFDECYRAFRGGRPDLAGAVCLKDGIYFRANMMMWNVLENDVDISYDKFVDIIEGRVELLS